MRIWTIYQGPFGEWRWRRTDEGGARESPGGFARLHECTTHVLSSGFDPAWDHLVFDEGETLRPTVDPLDTRSTA